MEKPVHQRCETCSRSPRATWICGRRKLQEVVNRHEECRMAFRDLRSQVNSALMEVGDVFESLSVPLMRLVGLKVEEMAGDGKHSTIIINPEFFMDRGLVHRSVNRCFASAKVDRTCDFAGKMVNGFHHDLPVSNEEGVTDSTKARETCEEIFEKQRKLAQRLIRLLHSILAHLSSNQEIIHSTLDYTHHSLSEFIERATVIYSPSCQSQHQSEIQATSNFVSKVLHATYLQLSSSLEEVQQAVDRTLGAIAEATSGVMVCQIENILADAESGALVLLCSQVREMENTISKLAMELEATRKRIKIAEKEKPEAVNISRDIQTEFMHLRGDRLPPSPAPPILSGRRHGVQLL